MFLKKRSAEKSPMLFAASHIVPRSPHSPRRGLLLIVMVGLLTLLTILAVLFVSLSRVERSGAVSNTDAVRAKLLSRSGIEYAVARLLEPGSAEPQLGINSEDDWRYRDDPSVPLEISHNPSFHAGEPWDEPLSSNGRYDEGVDSWNPETHDLDFNGRYSAWSGRLRGTHAAYSDRFKLRIEDTAAMISLNGNGEAGLGAQPGLDRMLSTLGEWIDVRDLVRKTAEARPLGSWTQTADVLGRETLDRIRPYVTLWGRVDPATFRPAPPDRVDGTGIRSQLDLNRIGRPQVEPRVPVNLNLAAQPVLVSLFNALSARGVRRRCEEWTTFNGNDGGHFIGRIGTWGPVPLETAETLAGEIVRYRQEDPGKPLRSWREFNRFLEEQAAAQGITDDERALVSANCNPNGRLNKFNPNRLWDRPLDKLDLTVYTTEGRLSPSGWFEIASLGEMFPAPRVFSSPDGETSGVRGSLRIDTVVSLWDAWRETNQADFFRGSVSANSAPMAAPSFRSRSLQLYPEPDTVDPSPAEGGIALAANRSERIPGDEGETERQLGIAVIPDPALTFYARYENGLDADYSKYGGDRTCYRQTDSDPSPNPEWHGRPFPPGVRDPSFRPNENPVLGHEGAGYDNRQGPGSLYPDGVYSDYGNLPFYSMEGHFQTKLEAKTQKVHEGDGSWNGKRLQVPMAQDALGNDAWWEGEDRGTVAFWVKPASDKNKYVQHRFFSASYAPWFGDQWSWRFQMGGPSGLVTTGGGSEPTWWGFHMEPDDDFTWEDDEYRSGLGLEGFDGINESNGGERVVLTDEQVTGIPSRGVWMHWTGGWDQRYADAELHTQFYLNDVRGTYAIYAVPRMYDWRRLYRADDGVNRMRFRLGETHRGYGGDNSPACATIDEFCLYEEQKTLVDGEGTFFAVERFRRGRYYNLGDGAFTSGSKPFEEGTQFLKMNWTTLIPGDPVSNHRILLDFFDGRKWLIDLDNDGRLSEAEETAARARGLTDEGGTPVDRDAVSESRNTAPNPLDQGVTPADGLIRYRAYFKEDANWLTTPLLESPVLDDVTITYIPPGGPRLIRWSE